MFRLYFIIRKSLTLLFCAGGQLSSRTPNVTPAVGLLSWGFFFSPGIPLLHTALSLGGLESSETHISNVNTFHRHQGRNNVSQCQFRVLCFTLTSLLLISGRVGALTLTAPTQQSMSDAERLS